MRKESAPEQLRQDLHRLLENIRGDLDRIELLTAAIGAFSGPIPDYEPGSRLLQHSMLKTRTNWANVRQR